MSSAASATSVSPPAPVSPLRLWPGVIIVAVLWAFFEVLPRLELESRQFLFYFQWGSMGLIGLFGLWWLFLSRAPWFDRIALFLLCAAAGTAVWPFTHPSVEGYGALMYVVYAIPVVLAVWMIWLVATPFLGWQVRRAGLWVLVAIAWIYPTLLRLDGTTSDIKVTVNFRWKPTPEEQFLAEKKAKAGDKSDASLAAVSAADFEDWPGFRGSKRDGSRSGVRINTDWQQHPPRLVWRQRVGPGWGSFTVVGNRLFTQEQRGKLETVVCYDAETGKEIWAHEDNERFYEAVGGPGPRGTPTFHEGRLYTLGATGKLDCLDAATGKEIWSKNIVADSGAKTQHWGFTASPAVAQGVVTVFAGGPKGKSVLGYKTASGDLAWAKGEGENSYSSTHVARLLGVEQILMATETGLTSFEPTTGNILWKYTPDKAEGAEPRANGAPITQPVVLNDSEVLYGTSDGGTWRIQVKQDGYQWSTKDVWASPSRSIKPYFNDMVIHDGYIYGFDGASTILFTCVDLKDGKTKWRERGDGGGQCLLWPDQNLILVLTEKNEVALVEANPEKRKELYKLPLLKGIKSWSHPVVARGKLFIRNDEEAACYDVAEVNALAAK
jgi:outer membrane protein assembly factor BamB